MRGRLPLCRNNGQVKGQGGRGWGATGIGARNCLGRGGEDRRLVRRGRDPAPGGIEPPQRGGGGGAECAGAPTGGGGRRAISPRAPVAAPPRRSARAPAGAGAAW